MHAILQAIPGLSLRQKPIQTYGHIVRSIFRASYRGKDVVVKVAFSEDEKREVQKNILGYERMKNMGIADVVPEYFVAEAEPAFVLILEDCGRPFLEMIKEAAHPAYLYQELLACLSLIWERTKQKAPPDSFCALDKLLSIALHFGDRHLQRFVQNHTDWEWLRSFSFRDCAIPFVCFSDYDFTPDDVFLSQGRLKYVDPNAEVIGVPIIDLACFSGVCLAHDLPDAEKQIARFHDVAIQEVAPLLSIHPEDAERMYLFGRFLQTTLSACVRIDHDPKKAERFSREALAFAKALHDRT